MRPVVLAVVRGDAGIGPDRAPTTGTARHGGQSGQHGSLPPGASGGGRVQRHDEQDVRLRPGGLHDHGPDAGLPARRRRRSRRWPAPRRRCRRRAVLAQLAVQYLRLPDPVIRSSPAPGALQLTELPTWLWVAPAAWHPQSKTAQVPGEAVTATATPVSAAWQMGDGRTVTCHGPGHPVRRGRQPGGGLPDVRLHLRPVQRRAARRRVPGHGHDHLGHHLGQAPAGRAGCSRRCQTVAAAEFRVAESQALNTSGGMTMAVLTRSAGRRRPAPPGPAPRRLRRRSVPLAGGRRGAGRGVRAGLRRGLAAGREPAAGPGPGPAGGRRAGDHRRRPGGRAGQRGRPGVAWSPRPARPRWRAARRRSACPRAAC